MSWLEWIWDNIAPDVRIKKNLAGPKTYEEAIAAWKTEGPKMQNALPLDQVEQMRGVAPYYFDWLSHPPTDRWWDWCELRNKYSRNHAAVLNLSAWYDDNYGPEGATTNFAGLLRSRAGQGDARTHLLLGPWVHGVDSTAKAKAGERKFAASAVIDYDEVVLRWMDHYLRGIDNGVEKERPVRYFVMGDDKWRESETWPPAAKSTPYYLHAAKAERELSPSLPRAQAESASFTSDPENPVTNIYDNSGAHDYRELAKRSDVLTFDTAALDHDVEVTGPIHAEIYLSCDCRDMDLWARLLDVAPDGTAFNLMSPGLDAQRLSYRDLSRGRQLLSAGKVYKVELPHLITSNVFKKGHRIRVQISGSFFPNFSRNLQTGEPDASSAKMKKAKVTIYTDAQHASRMVLPIVQR